MLILPPLSFADCFDNLGTGTPSTQPGTALTSGTSNADGTAVTLYVGIATDARDRLFNGHGVAENGDYWIYREAPSSDVARDIEKAYLDAGCDGGPGGGDDDSTFVYAYKKNSRTNP